VVYISIEMLKMIIVRFNVLDSTTHIPSPLMGEDKGEGDTTPTIFPPHPEIPLNPPFIKGVSLKGEVNPPFSKGENPPYIPPLSKGD